MADSSSNNNDDSTISQFLSFTGSTDTNIATQYLEMSGNNLEMAVSLWMDHNNGGGGGINAGTQSGIGVGSAGGGGGGSMAESDAAMAARLAQQDEVRAPDATRTMRLLGGDSPAVGNRGARLPTGGMAMAGLPPGMGAFADPGRDIPPHLLAAMGGPAAREMMMNMMDPNEGDATLGSMGSNWASNSGNSAAGGGSR